MRWSSTSCSHSTPRKSNWTSPWFMAVPRMDGWERTTTTRLQTSPTSLTKSWRSYRHQRSSRVHLRCSSHHSTIPTTPAASPWDVCTVAPCKREWVSPSPIGTVLLRKQKSRSCIPLRAWGTSVPKRWGAVTSAPSSDWRNSRLETPSAIWKTPNRCHPSPSTNPP